MFVFEQIVLPPHLERIREKLAENIHELWAVTRIEQGWTFGLVKKNKTKNVTHADPYSFVTINQFIWYGDWQLTGGCKIVFSLDYITLELDYIGI